MRFTSNCDILLFKIEVFSLVASSFISLEAHHDTVWASDLCYLRGFVHVDPQDWKLRLGFAYDATHYLTWVYANADATLASIFETNALHECLSLDCELNNSDRVMAG